MGEQARELQNLMGFFKLDERDLKPQAMAATAEPPRLVGKTKTKVETRTTQGARSAVKPTVATKPKSAPTEEKKPTAGHAASEEWEEF